MSDADLLRRAAALMRERAEAATSGPWEFRPRRGFESMRDNPATIGFLDTAGYFVMLREGTWTTEADMTHVVSWHPAVALAVADWLDAEAASHRADLVGPFPSACCRMSQARAVARAFLGSDDA